MDKINSNNQSLSALLKLKRREAGPNQPNPNKSHIYKDGGKISLGFWSNILEHRFLIPKLTDNVTIYWSELADLIGWRSGVLPSEQPASNWAECDGRNPGILWKRGDKKPRTTLSVWSLLENRSVRGLRYKSGLTSIQAGYKSIDSFQQETDGRKILYAPLSVLCMEKLDSIRRKASALPTAFQAAALRPCAFSHW